MRVACYDNFLKSPMVEYEAAQKAPYITELHNGLHYPGISLHTDPASEREIERLLGFPEGNFTTFYRRYLKEETQGTFIHNDCQIGLVSGILFLTLPEHCKGGVAFWRHKLYGWEMQPTAVEIERLGLKDCPELWQSIHQDGLDEPKWQMVDYVPIEFNRLILFDSKRYHSRYPKEPIGTGPEDCRLIKTFFYAPRATP